VSAVAPLRAWLDGIGDSITAWSNPDLTVQPTKVLSFSC
jgi:hypothetical protein